MSKVQAAEQVFLRAAEYAAKNPRITKTKAADGHDKLIVRARVPLVSWLFVPKANATDSRKDGLFVLRIVQTATGADAEDMKDALYALYQKHLACVDFEGLADGWKSLRGLLQAALDQRWNVEYHNRPLGIKGKAFLRLPTVKGGRTSSSNSNVDVVDTPDWARIDGDIVDEDVAGSLPEDDEPETDQS